MQSTVQLATLLEPVIFAIRFTALTPITVTLPLNASVNSFVQDLAEKSGTVIWLGLRCPDTNVNNCRWEDGMGAPAPYNAFYPGNPSGIGECVLMMVSGTASGRWITGDCNSMQIGFASNCGDYDLLGSYCYKGYSQTPLSQYEAESFCQNECGHLVSIHSSSENQMITNFYANNVNYIRIGLESKYNVYAWSDRTNFDYSNIGYENAALGDCVVLSAVYEMVNRGQWISASCDQKLPFICKRREGDCEISTVGTTSLATLAPTTCSSPQFFNQNGTVITFSSTHPVSRIRTVTRKRATILLQSLKDKSSWRLRSVVRRVRNGQSWTVDFCFVRPKIAIYIITSTPIDNTYFSSTTNVMKMIFLAGSDAAGINRWEAEFHSKPDVGHYISPGGVGIGLVLFQKCSDFFKTLPLSDVELQNYLKVF
ncbi:unnamed protein product [Strongylus vulgaris]|uniref:C-type lectin domain-containing protein n=1 Tax=Strongylus vulgaris TaxID=40348 RepID=A0A3P7JU18_STRVU|nr:unnamed protein product [Strongylus vulgaris]